MNKILNLCIYQIIWFLCVLWENLGAWLALPLLVLHLWLSPYKKADLKMMALLLAGGAAVDGALHFFGFIRFNVPALPIPMWLAVIWLALATLPHHGLSWLKGRPILSAILGAVGGALAYGAGVRMGAAAFTGSWASSMLIFAVIWAVIFPAIMGYASLTTAKDTAS